MAKQHHSVLKTLLAFFSEELLLVGQTLGVLYFHFATFTSSGKGLLFALGNTFMLAMDGVKANEPLWTGIRDQLASGNPGIPCMPASMHTCM